MIQTADELIDALILKKDGWKSDNAVYLIHKLAPDIVRGVARLGQEEQYLVSQLKGFLFDEEWKRLPQLIAARYAKRPLLLKSDQIRREEDCKLQHQNEMSKIKDICLGKGVTELVHFTPADNLKYIFQLGLVPRATLEQKGYPFVPTDEDRVDHRTNSVSLSVSFPNY